MSATESAALETRATDVSSIGLAARQIAGLLAYSLRESLHRWTLIAYLLGITFFLLLLATAVNLDVVEGTLASARLFGQDLEVAGSGITITDVVRTFQIVIITMLYVVGVALALFLSSSSVPAIAREGWVDLLVAQPISRTTLLLGRALGSFVVVSIGVGYLILGSWLVLRLKTGFGTTGYLLAGLVILFTFAVSYSASVLVGIVTRNGPVSGLAAVLVWVSGHPLYAFHAFPEWQAALRAGWPRQLAIGITEGLYWLLPKSQGLWQIASQAARGETVSLAPVWYSLPFAFLCLGLACWWFKRNDY